MLRFKHKSVVSTFYLVPERLRNKTNSPMFDPKKMLKNFMSVRCLSCSFNQFVSHRVTLTKQSQGQKEDQSRHGEWVGRESRVSVTLHFK